VASTQDQISAAIARIQSEVPALAQLKLVFGLGLRARGDVQEFRIELPGPQIRKGYAEDGRVHVELDRAQFNELAEKGTVAGYRRAYDTGHFKVSGDPNVAKLVGQVIARHEERARLKKVH
jgi:hypothetical protein